MIGSFTVSGDQIAGDTVVSYEGHRDSIVLAVLDSDAIGRLSIARAKHFSADADRACIDCGPVKPRRWER